jgi:dipeptidyl aminopeptidase/acylaminoacyl peptidase
VQKRGLQTLRLLSHPRSIFFAVLSAATFLYFLGDSITHAQVPTLGSRSVTLDDLFNLRQLARFYGGGVAFSPKGARVAFAVQRPYSTKKLYTDGLFGVDRSDIYVASISGGRPVRITDGASDGASYWAPSWSPDGGRLAMLSTKGGNVNLWIWKSQSGSLHQATDRAVDLSLTGAEDRPYCWISPTRVLLTVLPSGMKPSWLFGSTRGPRQAMTDWLRAWGGKDVTVSILTSGTRPDFETRPQSPLVEVDVESAKMRALTTHTVRNLTVSPDRTAVAYLRKTEEFQPQSDEPLPMNDLFKDRAGKFRLEIISTEGASAQPHIWNDLDVVPMSLRWSLDGQELAFLAFTKNRPKTPQLARFLKTSGTLKLSSIEGIDPIPLSNPGLLANRPQLEWTKSGWLIYAASRNDAEAERVHARRDWWLLGKDGRLSSITRSMLISPGELYPFLDDETYLGVAGGDLWRISATAQPQIFSASFGKRITRILWPQETRQMGNGGGAMGTYDRILVVANKEIFLFELASGRMTPISPPAPDAAVIAFSPESGALLFYRSNQLGLHLWIVSEQSGKASVLYEANTFLRNITPGAAQKIAYKGLDNRELEGWVILPPTYQPGRKLPLIVFVYPNWKAGASPGALADLTFVSHLNMQIAAAHGYAVLQPSIPLNPYGETDDALLRLTAGVLPAVDKVIEKGIGDPDRVFVMGQSNGGYAVYGLLTQTNRFKAAVAMAGYSDFISGYGQPGINRYNEYAQELLTATQQPTLETIFHLGSPPWKDLGRYMKNSPLFYIDRVQTPLMIIHGDLDTVPIEQAEEFFMAMYRQGKRAEFVRYWGEGHLILSPSNIRDMWKRIFAWFEEFSPQTPPAPLKSDTDSKPHRP